MTIRLHRYGSPLSLDEYKDALSDHWTCVWVGSVDPHNFRSDEERIIYTQYKGSHYVLYVKMSKYSYKDFTYVVCEHDPDDYIPIDWIHNSNGVTSVIPTNSLADRARAGTILGVCPFSDMVPVLTEDNSTLPTLLLCGLDIEMTSIYRDRFPLLRDPIISIALHFYDQSTLEEYGYFITHRNGTLREDTIAEARKDNIQCVRTKSCAMMVSKTIYLLKKHCPDFVCIHNGYGFDIPALAAHADRVHSKYFMKHNLGTSSSGTSFNIDGINTFDSMHYAMKVHRSDYKGLSLAAISESLGLDPKLAFTDFNINDKVKFSLDDMLPYNVHDARLHHQISHGTGFLSEICSLVRLTRSPVVDVTRFISGSFMINLISAYALSLGKMIVWRDPETARKISYPGGLVLTPTIGLHKNVAVLDFKSMYPSIMTTFNLSHDTLIVYDTRPDCCPDMEIGSVKVLCGDGPSATIKTIYRADKHIWYAYLRKLGIGSKCMKSMIDIRSQVKSTNPAMSWALKISANSFYGAYGYHNSALYCPEVAQTITGIGRYMLRELVSFVEDNSYNVIYGDTDSIFVIDPDTDRSHETFNQRITELIDRYHESCNALGWTDIVLEHEKTYSSIILMDKKCYTGITDKVAMSSDVNDDMTDLCESRGIASSRADRTPISKRTSNMITYVLMINKTDDYVTPIRKILNDTSDIIEDTDFSMDFTISVKSSTGYINRYKSVNGDFVDISQDMSSTIIVADMVPVDKEWVRQTVFNACDRILVASVKMSCKEILNGDQSIVYM